MTKTEGREGRLLFKGEELKIDSFELNTSNEELLKAEGEITFTGVYDPKDFPLDPSLAWKETGIEIVAMIHSLSGEKREGLIRVSIIGEEVVIEPIDEEIREWVKGWGIGTRKE